MASIPVSRIGVWIGVVILLAAGTLALAVFGGGGSTETVGPSAFSRSAIGYAGIADVMRRLGARVIKSRRDSAAQLGATGVLIIAEPSSASTPQMYRLMNAHTVLLVLPKWTGPPSPTHQGWIDSAAQLSEAVARSAAHTDGITVVRVPRAAYWTHNEIGRVPVISEGGVQLIKSSRLRPVVGNDAGMLVGELRTGGRRLWILADPDVMQNHGIADPDNAVFSVALINALRGADGNVVFDEVVHGFEEKASSPLRLLFEFPFVLATVQGLLALALLLWATMRRFGAPVPAPVALPSGKRSLIEATANLLGFARHRPIVVQRYVHAIVQDVGRQLHAPAGLSETALADWVARTGRGREAEIDASTVLRRADALAAGGHGAAAQIGTLARDIFRWKGEVTDGRAGRAQADRGDPQRDRQGRRRAG
jgi:hypothetical protein